MSPSEFVAAVRREHINTGKIDAIKFAKQYAGLGLRAAKEFVETLDKMVGSIGDAPVEEFIAVLASVAFANAAEIPDQSSDMRREPADLTRAYSVFVESESYPGLFVHHWGRSCLSVCLTEAQDLLDADKNNPDAREGEIYVIKHVAHTKYVRTRTLITE